MNGDNGRQRGNEATRRQREPFGLARKIITVARKCLNDEDRTPYAMVIGRNEIEWAHDIWMVVRNGEQVEMGIEPDQGNRANSVLLFSRQAES